MSSKQADPLKQSKLDFSATKRTASTGKTKSTSTITAPRPKATSNQPSPSPAAVDVETSSKASVRAEDSVKDEIEPAEDLVDNDSESVSSVSTWETLEQNPDTGIAKAPAATTPIASTTKSNARVTRAASQKKVVPGASPKVEPKVEEPVKIPFKQSNATDEQVEKTVQANSLKPVEQSPQELKVKAVKYRKYHDELKAKTGDVPTIHAENENKIHQILRFFDTSYEYGPCVGVSRRERWDRAQALGLNPPKEVDEILNTKQGRELSEYAESVFYGQV